MGQKGTGSRIRIGNTTFHTKSLKYFLVWLKAMKKKNYWSGTEKLTTNGRSERLWFRKCKIPSCSDFFWGWTNIWCVGDDVTRWAAAPPRRAAGSATQQHGAHPSSTGTHTRPLTRPTNHYRSVAHFQRCGTVTIFYCFGSRSDFWKVTVSVPGPTFEKLWYRFRFRFLLLKSYGPGSCSSSISRPYKANFSFKNLEIFHNDMAPIPPAQGHTPAPSPGPQTIIGQSHTSSVVEP